MNISSIPGGQNPPLLAALQGGQQSEVDAAKLQAAGGSKPGLREAYDDGDLSPFHGLNRRYPSARSAGN